MTTVLLLLVCLLAAVVFIQLGALVEMYGQLQQVRTHLDMVDRPNPVELGVGPDTAPSDVGLPAELDTTDRGLVLFLSNKCQTCFDIASTLNAGMMPAYLWLVVVPVSGGDASEFVEQFDLRGERVLIDAGEQIVGRLGLDVTPSAITVEHGRLARAQTVPTWRQLYQMVPEPRMKQKSKESKEESNGKTGKLTIR